ncbi:MAG: outer membrane lipoprotein-sorting protein [Deltaproteobacteria bacterium]|nr:outer membrane lipoprotein-sorting protein [Deltaproteobacteria bacterium]
MTWTYVRFAALLGALLWTLPTAARADDSSARELLQRMIDAVPRVPFFAKVKLSSTTRGWVRDLQLSFKRVDDADATYMEVTAPLDVKDTRFLLYDRAQGADEQWLYVPMMKRSIRVSETVRKQAFLGSDFYVSDMVRPDLNAFQHAFVGEEDVGGRHCKLVESVPKAPAGELYSKTVVAVDPADLVVTRSQFFDQKGKLWKVWTIDKIEKIDGLWTPLVQQMVNVHDNTQSRLEITEIKYNAELSDEMFHKAYLIR